MDDREAAERWERGGGAALTAEGVPAPLRLVLGVAELVERLDARGTRLAEEFAGGGIGVLTQRAGLLGLPRSGRVSAGGATRLVAAADGEVALSLARPSDRELLPAWAALAGTPREHWAEGDATWGDVDALAGVTPAAALSAAGAELGLPCAAVGEVVDARPLIVDSVGAAAPRAVPGARVVNLGSLWAAPLAAHLLARAGADVVTVESAQRPDGSRATPAFFAALRAGVRGVTVDFGTEAGRAELAQLLAQADVVIEGSRPRALRQLGFETRDVVAAGPQVWVSITGYGRTGAHAARVGFGDDCAAAGGLVGRTADGVTVFLADAIADPLTGLTAAAAVIELLERGGRHVADVALARVACSLAGPLEHS